MSTSTLRKLPGGCYAITLCLPPEVAAFVERECRARGFADADDYLSCVLNTAMFEEMETEPSVPMAMFDEGDDHIPF